jgi:hypothetical protein
MVIMVIMVHPALLDKQVVQVVLEPQVPVQSVVERQIE